ncbi:double zinc ribbon domain-containing protein [Paraburkholderia graminis]|uniref:double zinc ribbon domain-containing protein n=1 Tax=Paraburkholderia graminis TaxID=60548 RepID=UPI0035B510B5
MTGNRAIARPARFAAQRAGTLCRHCANVSSPDAHYCRNCGASLAPLTCAKCTGPVMESAGFCERCGTPCR